MNDKVNLKGDSANVVPDYPDAAQLHAYGALCFLYSRAKKYDLLAFRDIRLLIQPPIDLRFYHIIEVEDVPRAAITWGFLSDDAQARLIAGKPVLPTDWASGNNLWIMELIAPFTQGKLGATITQRFLDSVPPAFNSARFPRFGSPGVLKHITEFRRVEGEDKWKGHRIAAGDPALALSQE